MSFITIQSKKWGFLQNNLLFLAVGNPMSQALATYHFAETIEITVLHDYGETMNQIVSDDHLASKNMKYKTDMVTSAQNRTLDMFL